MQGSVLGPLLSIAYTGDLKHVLTSQFTMYVDDIKIYDNSSNFQNLTQDLHVIYNWCPILYVDNKNPRDPYFLGNFKFSNTESTLF